jgi:hypothetical protein
MREIKVMADYQCHLLWDMSPGMYGEVAPNTLPISVELKRQFADWARVFDETLDMSDPASSGLKSVEAETAFKAKVVELAEQLQKEIGVDFLSPSRCNLPQTALSSRSKPVGPRLRRIRLLSIRRFNLEMHRGLAPEPTRLGLE